MLFDLESTETMKLKRMHQKTEVLENSRTETGRFCKRKSIVLWSVEKSGAFSNDAMSYHESLRTVWDTHIVTATTTSPNKSFCEDI